MIRDFRPLDIHFNVAVRRIANVLFPCGFDVSEDAPSTLRELTHCIEQRGRLIVYSCGSERTIFDCAETNYAFRAWHDWCHWKGQHDFDVAGELMVAQMQKAHLRKLYPGNPSLASWFDIIDAEVIGQNEYNAKHGKYPSDQMGFVLTYLYNRKVQRELANQAA